MVHKNHPGALIHPDLFAAACLTVHIRTGPMLSGSSNPFETGVPGLEAGPDPLGVAVVEHGAPGPSRGKS
jgi:hypothetical protein